MYYCSGCMSEEDQKRELEELKAEALAEKGIAVSDTSSSSEEKSISEISTELNISPRTVENHLFVSRKVVRDFIRQCI